ncbi:MAG: hypothetical protein ABIP14_17325, partial [Blastocatellia bacterium]
MVKQEVRIAPIHSQEPQKAISKSSPKPHLAAVNSVTVRVLVLCLTMMALANAPSLLGRLLAAAAPPRID